MSNEVGARYYGEGWPLFGLYLRTTLLTLLTLGIYRFWAKTRIRKYIWSATSVTDDTFEYTGTGLEKLLGFLIAVVVLAIYLGLVQLGLAYFGLFLFTEPETEAQMIAQLAAFYISFLAVLPLLFFAQYRARRYRLARTRWRGLRFGMEPSALGYMLRALVYLVLTVISLGLLLPRQTFLLEKYLTDRSWYGEGRFCQLGRWTDLYPGLKHVAYGVGILVGSGIAAGVLASPALAAAGGALGMIWFLVGLVHYRVFAFNYLTRNKILDDSVFFDAELKTSDVLRHIIVGALLITGVGILGLVLISMVLGLTIGIGMAAGGLEAAAVDASPALLGLATLVTVVFYLGLILLIGGISLVLITQRIIADAVFSLSIGNVAALQKIRQRPADQGADAEGFADALDVGAAI